MAPDIRNFFGAPSSQGTKSEAIIPKKSDSVMKKPRSSRKVVEDSDDDEVAEPPKSKRVVPKTIAKDRENGKTTEATATTSVNYFEERKKSKASGAVEKPEEKKHDDGARVSPPASRCDVKQLHHVQVDTSSRNGINGSARKRPRDQKSRTQHEEVSSASLDVVDHTPSLTGGSEISSTYEEMQVEGGSVSSTRKRKLQESETKAPTSPRVKRGEVAKKAKKEVVAAAADEDTAVQEILDNVTKVKPPTPTETSAAQGSRPFMAGKARALPVAAGSKEVPEGAEDCLAGLSFVFTGALESLGREEGQELVKKYGGRVVGQPSKKTSFVVLGQDAGPKKLQTIKDHKIATINEDGLFELLRKLPAHGGSSKAALASEKKKKQEAEKIKKMVEEIERDEVKPVSATKTSAPVHSASSSQVSAVGDSRLWTMKYAPIQVTQICGNKSQVEKLQTWLRNFSKNQRTGFKLAGKDGSGIYRAVLIHGPPGIGKTTAAHLAAKIEGYDVVETNASDTRSKKMVETGLTGVLNTTSIQGYFAGDGKAVDPGKKHLVLIMDEVDGMSAGDRGGVGALAAICKKTQIPIILICNDRRQPKMKPFDFVTFDLPFRRPTTDMIRSRIMTIAYKEGLKIPGNVIDALIEGSGADIRQVINMISTVKVNQINVDFDQGKKLSKDWEKHVILKPWDITGKILSGITFAESSKNTVNDKIELYFNDHDFSYLMLQENYLGVSPALANRLAGKEKAMKVLDLVDKAASSISDGDLVDALIHGPQQHWSLMPAHAVLSFVRPASFVAGSMTGQARFTQWLGKNSNQGKLVRFVKEIQGHMRLRCSADRHEIRQQYIPMMWLKLINKLQAKGRDAVPEVIALMDEYYLTRDDFDAIMELGLGKMSMDQVKIESHTKANFTRTYNLQAHPLPFMKSVTAVAPKKSTREKPDLEEAMEDSDQAELSDDVKQEDDEDAAAGLSKDKYLRQPRKRATQSKGGGQKAKKQPSGTDKHTLELDAGDEVDGKGKKSRKGKAAKATAGR